MRKEKMITIFIIVVILGSAGFGVFYISNNLNQKESLENLEVDEIIEDVEQIKTEEKLEQLSNDEKKITKTHLANPRVQFKNSSGDEVVAIDHNGTISGENLEVINNITANQNISAGDSGFFNKIGSSISRVVNNWFEQVDINGTTTINANATFGDDDYVCLGDSGCSDSYMVFNGSSLIIKVN